jgi:hypothetical protein
VLGNQKNSYIREPQKNVDIMKWRKKGVGHVLTFEEEEEEEEEERERDRERERYRPHRERTDRSIWVPVEGRKTESDDLGPPQIASPQLGSSVFPLVSPPWL